MELQLILISIMIILTILLLILSIKTFNNKKNATYYKKQFQLASNQYTKLYLKYEKLKNSSLQKK